ncbi:MAG: type II toxin-antitoxin system PemK/MazF family toxin [Bdellovibrio bacteriovorus]
MTIYAFGDVILVPFPFTDQSTTKQRPAVVISSAGYHGARPDLILMAITRQVRTSLVFGERLITDWQPAGLIRPSILKPLVTTIERALVIKRLGKLSTRDQSDLRVLIATILG